jgi:protein TonB
MPVEKPPETASTAQTTSLNTDDFGAPGGGGPSSGPPAPKTSPPTEPPPPPPTKPKPAKLEPVNVPEGIAPPVPDPGNRQPEMPAQAIAEGKSGRVVVKFVVTETGTVENIQVLKGDEPFVTAVLEVVRTWRFTPTQMDGRPVPVFRTQPFTFNLRR